jgi:hypothetical protein
MRPNLGQLQSATLRVVAADDVSDRSQARVDVKPEASMDDDDRREYFFAVGVDKLVSVPIAFGLIS